MMRGRLPFALMLAAPAAAQLSAAQTSAAQASAAQLDVIAPAAITEPTADQLLLGVAASRMTVPVSIGGQGAWGFVIDTGAERTVISHELAARLQLRPGPSLRVTAMTGTAPTDSVIVPALRVSKLTASTITAPVFAAANLGALGILGIDALQGHSIDIDFDRERMALRPSRGHRLEAGQHGDEIVVVARSVYGQLIVTDAHWHGKRVSVIVDTGSAASLGNPALLALMRGRGRPLGPLALTSVTGATLNTGARLVDHFTLGGIDFTDLAIAFADATPFHRFGLEHKPALMLGMNTLRLFRRVRIDFATREVELTLPRGAVFEPRIGI